MLKDINTINLSGTIFWSKLDDRQSFSLLRIGMKLESGDAVFISINNPRTKAYDLIKPGNKVILANAWLDLWTKKDNSADIQIKGYDSHIQFLPKNTAIFGLNEITIVGTVVDYSGEFATIEMVGDRNPKTGQYARRKAIVKIGDKYKDINGKKIFLQARVTSIKKEDGKSTIVVEAFYDKIIIL